MSAVIQSEGLTTYLIRGGALHVRVKPVVPVEIETASVLVVEDVVRNGVPEFGTPGVGIDGLELLLS